MTPLNELECKFYHKSENKIRVLPACKYPSKNENLRILRNNYLKFNSKINPRSK